MKPTHASWLIRTCAGALLSVPAYSPALGNGTNNAHEFYFTRGMFSDEFSIGDDVGGSWSIDYPKADRHFLFALDRLSIIDASPDENAIKLTDPELGNQPFLYALEVGSMQLNQEEVDALRDYLLAGGFLFIDDFWGSWAWSNLAEQMERVFPGRAIVEIPDTHQIFNLVYEIEEIQQVPNRHNGVEYERLGITHEEDGRTPHVRGIFDDQNRMMVLINWNTDLGDAWEWADHPQYPSHFSTYAVKLGINTVVYAMTH
ncbi:MAG: DUF4159 domain-containing protein [Gammaproteobacteria bacterium]|nr:DUF4159 domain-containing protein [Gammaproteobacteria bacterium]